MMDEVTGDTAYATTQTETDSDLEYRRRRYQCGDFCSFNIFKIPRLLLRNILFQKEHWDEYPDGFDRIADRFVFQPDSARYPIPTPEHFEMNCNYEEVRIDTKDKVKIHAYLIKPPASRVIATSSIDENQNRVEETSPPSPPPTVPTIVYFHGNAGNIGYCLDIVKTYQANLFLETCNWLMVEYRGYGRSEGQQCEKGLYADAKAAFNWTQTRNDLNPNMIILMGHSLGGAVAIHLASRRRYRKKVAGLILENTFTSIPILARTLMNMVIIKMLPKCCYSCKFESINKIGRVKCPTLFVCGLNDEVVPCSMTDALYKKCGATVKVVERFEGGEHNDTYRCSDYLPKVEDFIVKNIVSPPQTATPKPTETDVTEPPPPEAPATTDAQPKDETSPTV